MNWFGKKLRYRKSTVSNQNCGIAHILGILLMNSCNTDIFFNNSYHLQSVRFEYLLRQTAGVVRISWQACWSKSSICTLVFSITKCFISFRQRLEMNKGKNTFREWNDQSGHQCHTLAQNPRDSSQLWPAAKDYYGIFGAHCSKLKKKLVLRTCMMRDKLFLDLRAKS